MMSHRDKIKSMTPLLLSLMTLNSSFLNPEINADLDDFLEDNDCGKRLSRRLKRSYYNALARECLRTLEGDPLKIYGKDSSIIMSNISKVPFATIGELKIGNKIYRINDNETVKVRDSKT